MPSFGLLIEGVRLADVFAGVLPPFASEVDVLDESFVNGESASDGLEALGSKEEVGGMAGTVASVGDAIMRGRRVVRYLLVAQQADRYSFDMIDVNFLYNKI